MSKPTHFTLTFATNYNGMHLCVDWENDLNKKAEELTFEQECLLDDVGELAGKTYEWCNKWDCDLSEAQIQELINDAKEIIKEEFPIAHIEFEYDDRST